MSETLITVGTWLQAIFTLLLLSVVFKDSPAYRFAEHTYVGLWAGYTVALAFFQYIRPTIVDSIIGKGELHWLVPMVVGLLMYTRYVKSIAWLSRYSLCFTLGIGTGYVLSKDMKPLFMDQIRATFLKLWGVSDWWVLVSNWIFVIGTVASLVYFMFTLQKKGVQGGISKVGRIVMMVAFGSAFGNTVMARVSLFLGRMQFLLGNWLKLITTRV